tara:strand:- start:1240 stop:2187 length:948 start_codon:yes stop_codon:yes gene_type:complete
MKIIKEVLKIIFFIFFVNINSNALALTKNKIIASVDNQIVSSYELKNKVKTILFLANQNISQKNVNLIKQKALQQLIDYKLKKNQVIKFKVQLNNNDQIIEHLNNLSSKYQTDVDGMKNIFQNNALDFQIYLDEIKTEFSWQKLIFEKYQNKIPLNEKEVENELNNFLENQSDLQEYKLAEIELPLKNNAEDKNTILEVNEEINKFGFKNAAIKYSISNSSSDGGDIGWINAKSLSEKILFMISKMKVGETSQPIIQTDRIIILKLLDQKKIDISEVNVKELRKKIIRNKQNQLLSLYSNNHLSKLKNNALIEIK